MSEGEMKTVSCKICFLGLISHNITLLSINFTNFVKDENMNPHIHAIHSKIPISSVTH